MQSLTSQNFQAAEGSHSNLAPTKSPDAPLAPTGEASMSPSSSPTAWGALHTCTGATEWASSHSELPWNPRYVSQQANTFLSMSGAEDSRSS